MINIGYQKRSNVDLFRNIEQKKHLNLSETQNYIPIYKRFFSLNPTNYNNINLNNEWHILNICVSKKTIEREEDENNHVYKCNIKNINTQNIITRNIFFKFAPLLDPHKYLIGKYDINDKNLFKLPNLGNENSSSQIFDINNSAYVDGFFSYLSSSLINKYNFIHGVDFYGSFLALKNNFTVDVYDDLEYLNKSEFFNKNKNILFKVDNYDHLFVDNETKLPPIKIEHTSSVKSNMSIQSIGQIDGLFENIFSELPSEVLISENNEANEELVDMTNADIHDIKIHDIKGNNMSLRSNSSCSSRTSHTNSDENDEFETDSIDDYESGIESINNDGIEDNEDEYEEDEYDSEEEEEVNVSIPQFPIEIICMENCENTLDSLIITHELTHDEWYSALMQIIMILITYQKAFSFTHNDLHTNNVMYNSTNKKFIYYHYKKRYYRVPTFGRIFKIIDFGRSIYKFNGKLFCSDSFKTGGDAATQYNTEPYLNEKKPRLDPNYSFDLCRLACSIFDYLISDMNEIKNCNQLQKLIVDWCLDDKGVNMLYKNNNVDRYPDFKLYKMIARCVHNHTPQAQLERPQFKKYIYNKENIPNDVIDIDKIPIF